MRCHNEVPTASWMELRRAAFTGPRKCTWTHLRWHIDDEKIEISPSGTLFRAHHLVGDPVRAFTAKCLLFVNELTRRNASEKEPWLGQEARREMKSVSPMLSEAPGWNSSCERGNAGSTGELLIRNNGALENSSATSARNSGPFYVQH